MVTLGDPWLFIGKSGVRLVVGGLGRGPRAAGGVPGARRPDRAAAGADVLRHRDTSCPWLLARRAAEAGWELTYVEEPDLIHVYPILLASPRPAGPGGRPWPSCRGTPHEGHGGRSTSSTRGRRTTSGGCARRCSCSSRSAPYGDLDGRDLEPGTRHVCSRTTTARCSATRGCSTTTTTWRIGRVAPAPTRARPRTGGRADAHGAVGLRRPRRRPGRSGPAGRLVRDVRLRGHRPGVPGGRDSAPADAAARAVTADEVPRRRRPDRVASPRATSSSRWALVSIAAMPWLKMSRPS